MCNIMYIHGNIHSSRVKIYRFLIFYPFSYNLLLFEQLTKLHARNTIIQRAFMNISVIDFICYRVSFNLKPFIHAVQWFICHFRSIQKMVYPVGDSMWFFVWTSTFNLSCLFRIQFIVDKRKLNNEYLQEYAIKYI